MKLDMAEFVMLAGTELAVTLIRNRITLTKDMLDEVLDFVDEYSTGFYHVRVDPTGYSYIYFENVIDKENTVNLCHKIRPDPIKESKYH